MVWTGAIAALVLACSLLAMGGAQADTNPGLTLYEGGQVAEAAQSWRAAADGGDATAALYLGVLYDTGSGVPRDAAVALTWYERAAALGNAAAAFNVGVMFDAGVGRDADPATAAVWYRKAAAKGFGRAEYNLALLYETGSGVRVNRRRAAVLFRAAAAHGIAAANSHLTQLGVHPATLGPASDDPAMLQFTQAEAILRRRGPPCPPSSARRREATRWPSMISGISTSMASVAP